MTKRTPKNVNRSALNLIVESAGMEQALVGSAVLADVRVATQDQPLGLNVTAERCAFTVASRPAAGQTDNGFILGKMVVMAATCPVAQTAGSVV